MKTMKTLDQLDAEALRDVRILLTDIDDTITSDGQLEAEAYGALHRLNAAGIAVIPVTGRPAGWCDHIARMWPVAGVVGENGAFYFIYYRKRRKMRQVFWTDAESMRGNRARLDRLGTEILAGAFQSQRLADRRTHRGDAFRSQVAQLLFQLRTQRLHALRVGQKRLQQWNGPWRGRHQLSWQFTQTQAELQHVPGFLWIFPFAQLVRPGHVELRPAQAFRVFR